MSISDNSSLRSYTVSLDLDVNEAAHNTRKYPSVKDYYLACSTTVDKPIQLQKGLSNYSSLKLGDDRIAFNESVISEAFRLPMEEKLQVDSPSRHKSSLYRKREYHDAKNKVGEAEIDRMELVMKDKLIQRSFARASPFQVRKAFKFYDREKSMKISIEGFTKALESLGFQFSEFQNMALFARYDPDYTGSIDYMEFISKAMYYSANEDVSRAATSQVSQRRTQPVREPVPDMDINELNALQRVELKKVFDKIDRTGSGYLSRADFEVMLMALGYYVIDKDVASCFADMGLNPDANQPVYVSFETFFNWWTSSNGESFLARK